MKKKLLFILLAFLPAFLTAMNQEILETGSLLFIEPKETCTVYLDGEEIGISPLLLTDISRGNKSLQLLGRTSFAEMEIEFIPGKKEITYLLPEMSNYFGYLKIENNMSGISLSIDGVAQSISTGNRIQLDSGQHIVQAKKQNYAPREFIVDIPRLGEERLEITLNKSFIINFTMMLPEGTTISFTNENKQGFLQFSEDDDIRLESGEWSGKIENPLFEEVEFNLTVDSEPVFVNLPLAYYQPYIKLVGLLDGSSIFLGEKEVTELLKGSNLSLPLGSNQISIYRDNYLPITDNFSVEGNEVLELVLDYQKDPLYVQGRKKTTSVVLLISGMSLLAGGIILNNDTILTNITSSYDTYSGLKYSSLGISGAGLAMFLTGAGIGIGSLVK